MSDPQPEGLSLKVFKTAKPGELIDILKKLKSRELKLLSQITKLHFGNSKFITAELVNLFETQLLRRDAVFNAEIFAKMMANAPSPTPEGGEAGRCVLGLGPIIKKIREDSRIS